MVKNSPCKVNLLLNVLGRRADGFHDLETVMQPVNLFDTLAFERIPTGIELSSNDRNLPLDRANLVYRAAEQFLLGAGISGGVKIHLEKKIPVAAGLGGGSGNAGTTLLALNELFEKPFGQDRLLQMASGLGSDVPFFLQRGPALALGRGEQINPLEKFSALAGKAILLIHPGFGISTPWAYQNLARFPNALNGKKGRARELISLLQNADLKTASAAFFNSLEAPAFEKFPVLMLFKEFLTANGAAALMSGSGSATFAVCENVAAAEALSEKFKSQFGANSWTATVVLD